MQKSTIIEVTNGLLNRKLAIQLLRVLAGCTEEETNKILETLRQMGMKRNAINLICDTMGEMPINDVLSLIEEIENSSDPVIKEIGYNKGLRERRTAEEIKELIDLAIRYSAYSEDMLVLITSSDILMHRTYRQQGDLIKKTMRYYYNDNYSEIYSLAISKDVLHYRRHIEQMEMLDTMASATNENRKLVENLLTNEAILQYTSKKEQLNLVKILTSQKYVNCSLGLACNKDVWVNRSFVDVLRLLKELESAQNTKCVYRIAVDKNVLEHRSIEQQLELINMAKACNFDPEMMNIILSSLLLTVSTHEDHMAYIKEKMTLKETLACEDVTTVEDAILTLNKEAWQVYAASLPDEVNLTDYFAKPQELKRKRPYKKKKIDK